MKTRGIFGVILLIGILFTAGCLNPRPRFTKHYKSAIASAYSADKVKFSVFSLEPQSESARTTLLNLSERGQAAFIESLATKSDTAKSLIQSMATVIEASPQTSDVIDRTKIKRRLVFSIEHRPDRPADRVAECTVHATISGGTFANWNQFVSKYETIDLGSLKATQTRELTQNVKLAPPQIKEIAEISFGAKQGSSLEEALQLKRRYVVSSGVLLPSKASLMQQGTVGIDLTGNFSVDFDISVPQKRIRPAVFYFENFRNAAGNLSPVDDVRLRKANMIVPDQSTEPVKIICSADIKVREVIKGDDTLAEGDDKVAFATKSIALAEHEIVKTTDLRCRVFVLKVASRNEPVEIQDVIGNPGETLLFSDLKNAEGFLDFLRDHVAAGAGAANQIKISKRPLTTTTAGAVSRPLNWADVSDLVVEGYDLN